MELGTTSVTAEPIVLDLAALGNRGQSMVHYMLANGEASFDDDLQDAVALNRGIDEEGRLDMDMLEAVRAAEAYLAGRQGQPVVLASLIHDADGRLLRIDALLGVLGDGDKLIGTFEIDGWKKGGIRLRGACYQLDADAAMGHLRLNRCMPAGSDTQSEDLLPLSRPALTIGKPGREDAPQSPHTYTQELVAGDDIMPWLQAQCGTGQAGYELFTGLLRGIRDRDAQAFILQDPFRAMLDTELRAFGRMSQTLDEADTRVARFEKAREGALAEAAIELTMIAEDLDPSRVPYTRDSNRTHLTADIGSRQDIAARKRTLDETQRYLSDLVID